MKYLFLDIETVPIEIKDETIREYLMDKQISKEMRAFNPSYSKIITICIKPLGEEIITLTGNETEILTKMWQILSNENQKEKITIVTHNGYQFDIPFLILRSITNDVTISININTNKWSMENSNHFDTMLFFSQYGTFTNTRLTILGKMFDIETPGEGVSGADVERLYHEGKIELINKHCKEDVELLEKVFSKKCIKHLEARRSRL
ncbi:MAG: ribonuclease H-like domain-containing protein [Candidatus Woesearchaeota archaeon]